MSQPPLSIDVTTKSMLLPRRRKATGVPTNQQFDTGWGFTGTHGNTNPDKVSRIRVYKPATVDTLPWDGSGVPPMTNWQRSSGLIQVPSFRYYERWVTGGLTNENWSVDPVYTIPTPVMEFSLGLKSRVTNETLARIKDQSVDLSVAFGERRETARLLEQTCKGFCSGAVAFAQKHPREWAQLLRAYMSPIRRKEVQPHRRVGLYQRSLPALTESEWRLNRPTASIPDRWLEYWYGWVPTFNDLYGSIRAVQKAQQDRAYWCKVEWGGKQSEPFLYKVFSGSNGQELARSETQKVYRCKYVIYYGVASHLLPDLSGLGLTNPASTLYELTRLSFVFDWFLDIGGWLSTFDAFVGREYLGGCISESCEIVAAPFVGVPVKGARTLEATAGENIVRWKEFRRTKLTSPPSGMYPNLRNPVSLNRLATALSLAVTSVKKHAVLRT